jgi:murein hydrolase activator
MHGTSILMMNRGSVRSSALYAGLLLAFVFAAASLATAQQVPATRPAAPVPEARQQHEQQLRDIEETLARIYTENAQLAAEMAQIRGDRARLNTELVTSSRRVQEAEGRFQTSEQRLKALEISEIALKRSLDLRKNTIVEVLASLQRIGRKPPPAVLVRPEDILQSIRTSMLLGAVLPELRHEAEILIQDLSSLVANREAAARERDILKAETETLRSERQRLTALMATRQLQLETGESRLVEERRKVQQLVKEANSLKELISRIETEITSARRAALAASVVPLPSQNPAQAAALAPGALRDMARLQPKIAFLDTKGTLSLPAKGTTLKSFGTPDGFGGRENGISLETSKFALVTAPADGWVSFAGSYRSYGQVLIINAGGGYRMVMTGLDRINVDIGQFVLSGEPIASMGESPAAALVSDIGAARDVTRDSGAAMPVLYIEIRKDGVPIDPGPWWVKADGEKVRG